jgi:hypothetical protein
VSEREERERERERRTSVGWLAYLVLDEGVDIVASVVELCPDETLKSVRAIEHTGERVQHNINRTKRRYRPTYAPKTSEISCSDDAVPRLDMNKVEPGGNLTRDFPAGLGSRS